MEVPAAMEGPALAEPFLAPETLKSSIPCLNPTWHAEVRVVVAEPAVLPRGRVPPVGVGQGQEVPEVRFMRPDAFRFQLRRFGQTWQLPELLQTFRLRDGNRSEARDLAALQRWEEAYSIRAMQPW
jgi:hypothetical protein